MDSIANILTEELTTLQADIIIRHEQAGQVASGKTKAEFESKLTSPHSGQLLGAGYSGVLERGRKPGKVPIDFVDILKRWAQAKGISFSNEKQFNIWANAVKWKITREGTKLYRSGMTEDIFTTPIELFQNRLSARVSTYFEEEVKKRNIHKMKIISTPDKFHAAFNPIIFEVQQDDSTETSASLQVRDENGNLIATLTRSFFGTTTKFDVSDVVNKVFAKAEAAFALGVAADKRLFVKYQVGGGTYIAINAAVEIGLPSSFSGQVGAILTSFSKAVIYSGYPFDISVLVNTSFSGLVAESVNRVQDAKNFLSSLNTDVYLADNTGDYILDNFLNFILLDRIGGSVTGNTFAAEDGCTPTAPFYIRWINKFGGIDYWMFQQSQEIKTALKSTSSFRKFYTDTEAENGSEVAYQKDSEDTITVGATQLTAEQYKALAAIPESPLVEWFNEATQKWVRLFNEKEDNSHNTRAALKSIELTFTLPKRNLQF